MSAPLVARMLVDAIEEFGRAVEHVPPPGRGGPIGRLNAASWVVAHAASPLDFGLNVHCQGLERDGWLAAWAAQRGNAGEPAPAPSFDEAREAFGRVAERAARYLQGCDEASLAAAPAGERPPGTSALANVPPGPLVARNVAHLFVHAGELSVIASLLARGDLGLPGALWRSTGTGQEAVGPADGRRPAAVAMLLDAREQLARVADAVPVPAQAGAFERLSSGGWIVAHCARQDDQHWNVAAQNLGPDAWLAAVAAQADAEPPRPDYAEARAALDRTYARSGPYLDGINGSELDTVLRQSRMPGRPGQTVADLLVRQATHYFVHAGELATIASLGGEAGDLGLPGPMPHTRAVWA